MKYGLGIDAGGTYTDAVLLEYSSGKVIAREKVLTDRNDPSDSIRKALLSFDAESLARVTMVSLATTFATNAIVEDRGAEAGLILLGYKERPPEIPVYARLMMAAGGHTVTGLPQAALDIADLRKKIRPFVEGLDAVAVASFFSVRNPEHEELTARLIRDVCGLPIVRGHRLSMRLDAVKRATTAWWNARLIPLISNLIKAAGTVLAERSIDAPLMVVRGDGTLMSAESALERPVDTLLSGPAASILGCRYLSGLDSAVIVDMGGTTTDIAVLSEGKVAIDPQGAQVGHWKTHVKAAKVRTFGIGGDSLVGVGENSRITVGPRKVLPLCLLSEGHPHVLKTLKTIRRILEGGNSNGKSTVPCSFYLFRRTGDHRHRLPEALSRGPVSEFLLNRDNRNWLYRRDLERYEREDILMRASLTPTDIRIATGRGPTGLGDRRASEIGLDIFACFMDMSRDDFVEAVEEEIRRNVCLETVRLVDGGHSGSLAGLMDRWFRTEPPRTGPVDLDVRVSLTVPAVGAGAPAAVCLPKAFERLHTGCVLPDHYDVSVAVGSVVGTVDETFAALVRKTDTGRFSLHTGTLRAEFDTYEEAVRSGRKDLEESARLSMEKNGIPKPLFDFSLKENKVKSGKGEEILLEAELLLQATGRPDLALQKDLFGI